jgi:hypothetical protein
MPRDRNMAKSSTLIIYIDIDIYMSYLETYILVAEPRIYLWGEIKM